MRRTADYESDDGRTLRIRPHMIYTDPPSKTEPELAYITIYTSTGNIHVNRDNIPELVEMVTEVKLRYLDKIDPFK